MPEKTAAEKVRPCPENKFLGLSYILSNKLCLQELNVSHKWVFNLCGLAEKADQNCGLVRKA